MPDSGIRTWTWTKTLVRFCGNIPLEERLTRLRKPEAPESIVLNQIEHLEEGLTNPEYESEMLELRMRKIKADLDVWASPETRGKTQRSKLCISPS